MNYQWSEYEKEELRNHKFKSIMGQASKGAPKIPETGVPVKIRLFYMKGYSFGLILGSQNTKEIGITRI